MDSLSRSHYLLLYSVLRFDDVEIVDLYFIIKLGYRLHRTYGGAVNDATRPTNTDKG